MCSVHTSYWGGTVCAWCSEGPEIKGWISPCHWENMIRVPSAFMYLYIEYSEFCKRLRSLRLSPSGLSSVRKMRKKQQQSLKIIPSCTTVIKPILSCSARPLQTTALIKVKQQHGLFYWWTRPASRRSETSSVSRCLRLDAEKTKRPNRSLS